MTPAPYYEKDGIVIYHGDCRDVLPGMEAGDAWVFDPPYSSGGFQEAGKASGSIGKMGYDTKGDRILADTLSTRGFMALMRECLRHSRSAEELAMFTDWRMWVNATDALEYAGWLVRAMVVWDKGGAGLGRPWRNSHELVAYAMRVSARKDRVAKQANVIRCSRSGNVMHPTEKPLDLITKIIDNMEGETILDPFMGSGTTLVAARDLGRKAIGIEIEERYCEIAAKRLSQGVLNFGGH